jgi:hypothetical protein
METKNRALAAVVLRPYAPVVSLAHPITGTCGNLGLICIKPKQDGQPSASHSSCAPASRTAGGGSYAGTADQVHTGPAWNITMRHAAESARSSKAGTASITSASKYARDKEAAQKAASSFSLGIELFLSPRPRQPAKACAGL